MCIYVEKIEYGLNILCVTILLTLQAARKKNIGVTIWFLQGRLQNVGVTIWFL